MNLATLSSADLKRMLAIKVKIEKYEKELLAVYEKAKRRPPAKRGKSARIPPQQQPSLRDLVSGILRKAKKPLSVHQIYEATLLEGYHWRSREPINALNVKMYTDKTFKKASPGMFVLRRGVRCQTHLPCPDALYGLPVPL